MARLASETACVATVTDDAYLPGTLVLLSSFLERNPWFRGEMVVIHDGLSAQARARLARFPRLRLHQVGPALKARLAALVQDRKVGAKLSHLFSLEVFNLPGHDWILALDSDILCTGSAEELVGLDGGLVCCPDQAYFWDQPRNRRTFEPTPRSGVGADVFPVTFNVGVMLITPSRFGDRVYHDLLADVRTETWAEVLTGHADSVVWNVHFQRRWTQAPEKFNYLISKGMHRYRRARCLPGEAVFLHFIGRPKPWQLPPAEAEDLGDPVRRAAFLAWQAAARTWTPEV